MLVSILISIKRKRARNIVFGLAFIIVMFYKLVNMLFTLAVDNLAKTLENLVHGAKTIHLGIFLLTGVVLGNNLCLLAVYLDAVADNLLRRVVGTT